MFRELVLSLAAEAGMVAQRSCQLRRRWTLAHSRREPRSSKARPSNRRSSSGAGGITAGTIQPGEARAGTGAATHGGAELARAAPQAGITGTTAPCHVNRTAHRQPKRPCQPRTSTCQPHTRPPQAAGSPPRAHGGGHRPGGGGHRGGGHGGGNRGGGGHRSLVGAIAAERIQSGRCRESDFMIVALPHCSPHKHGRSLSVVRIRLAPFVSTRHLVRAGENPRAPFPHSTSLALLMARPQSGSHRPAAADKASTATGLPGEGEIATGTPSMNTLELGEITIAQPHRARRPLAHARGDVPGLRRRACARPSRRAGPVRLRCRDRPDGDHLPDVRGAHAEAHDPRRYLHRRGQGLSAAVRLPEAALARQFRAAGLSFEAIDYVFCTHLHFDHCGWNTRLVTANGCRPSRTRNTFFTQPRIRPLGSRQPRVAKSARARREPAGEFMGYNCLPVVEAGQALLVDDDL